jgi:hypothetical protein
LKNQDIKIDACKTVISKPVNGQINLSKNQWVSSANLAEYYFMAYNQNGWFGGYANLDFQADTNYSFQEAVLKKTRDACFR